MNILQIAQDYGLKPKKVASTRGGEYQSACPSCNNPKRFKIHPNHEGGVYHCHSCGKGGDTIQFLRNFMGKSFKEAAEVVGKTLDDRPTRHRYTPRKETVPTMEAEDKILPEERWRREAAAVVGAAHEALIENKERLEWLAGRGIGIEAVKNFKLGWVEKDKFYGLTRWGLPEITNSKGNKKRLWIPRGYLIPQWTLDGTISMLQVRMDKLLPESDMRYYPVKGSTVTPMILAPSPPLPPERTAWVDLESRLDAILVAAHAGDLVGVMAQGNNSANPSPEAMRLLEVSPRILSSLDFDTAGKKSFEKWASHFKTVRHWPVPEGKDPGEYFEEHNGDIRAWVMAGLPPGLRINRKSKEPASVIKKEEKKEPLYTAINTKCGRLIHVTGDRGTYRKLEEEGKIVFSNKEVERATAFHKDGGEPSLLIDIKEILGGRINDRVTL